MVKKGAKKDLKPLKSAAQQAKRVRRGGHGCRRRNKQKKQVAAALERQEAAAQTVKTFPDIHMAAKTAQGLSFTHSGDIVTRATQDVSQAVKWIQEARRRRVPLFIQGLYTHKLNGVNIERIKDCSTGVLIKHDDEERLVDFTEFIESTEGCNGKGTATVMTMYEDHTAGASLFTDRRHAAFRRRIGHGLLRGLGDTAFGKEKVASDNLIVSCKTTNQDELRSHAHTDRYHGIMLVVNGRKVWSTMRARPGLWRKLRKDSNKLANALSLNTLNPLAPDSATDANLACLFNSRVGLTKGDVLYHAENTVHEVTSDPQTVATSTFYEQTDYERKLAGDDTIAHGLLSTSSLP